MIKMIYFNIILIVILFFNNQVHALCVSSPEANFRSGPGTKYEKTLVIFKYTPLQEISKKGNWYKVKDLDGDIGWIYRKLVTDKIKCAVVKTSMANIRSGPGKEYETIHISPAMNYDSFAVIKMKGSWVNVKDDFVNTGWILRELLWIK